MQLLGGQAPPRKYDYLTVYDPQENVFTCRSTHFPVLLSVVTCPCFSWQVGSQENIA